MATLRSYSALVDQLSPVAHWRFDEAAGTNAVDQAGARDGTYVNGVALGAAGVIGDGAARFAGDDDFMRVSAVTGAITVAAFGDSLMDNLEVADLDQRFAPELQAALQARGVQATVLDHATSGDTTAAGLARIDQVLADAPDIVVLELGTNDAIQGIALSTVESNLRSIITQLQDAGSEVLLTAAFAFYPERNGGVGYGDEATRDAFEAMYGSLAAEFGIPLLQAGGSDKFLGGTRADTTITGGVLGDPTLHVDGLHPNAAGVDAIVARVAPETAALAPPALALAEGTFEMWFVPDEVPAGSDALFSKNAAGVVQAGDIEARLTNGVITVGMQSATATHVVDSGAFAVTPGAPIHLAFTFGQGMALYLNGQLVDQNSVALGLTPNDEPLIVGAAGGTADFFAGVIDEFAIYDQALGAGQVEALFQAGGRGPTVAGTAAADVLIGGDDNDLLRGGPGPDSLRAGGGADVLVGAGGGDRLTGGPGPDTFRIASDAHGVDRVTDFQAGSGGDVLDLRAVLDGFVAGSSDPADFVQLSERNGNTQVAVDATGAGTAAVRLFNLVDVTGLELGQLVDDGNLSLA